MKNLHYTLMCCLFFLVQLHAQKNNTTRHLPQEEGTTWMTFEAEEKTTATELAKNKTSLQLGIHDELKLISTQDDELGYRHYHYQQTYKGFPIEGAVYLIHEKGNQVSHANGRIIQQLSMTTAPTISEATALQSAFRYVGATLYAWDDPTHQDLIKQIENRNDATFYPSGELVIIDPKFTQNTNNYRLTYKFDIYAVQPLSRQIVYVDAQNGTVLTSIEKIHSCTDTPASGDSNYSGTVDFMACQKDGTHTLKSNINGIIQQVFNANNALSTPEVPFTDLDGFFEADSAAVDVHFATQKTYEYFLNTFNRNSLDDNGTPLYSWVHYGNNLNNARWTGSWMLYGDGDGSKFSALTAPDVVAHEMTHGITEFTTSSLIYFQESGALNESFSDIFGEVIEAYIRGSNDWIIGADFTIQPGKNGMRNMGNPNDASMLTIQPDTYLGNYWYTGAGDNGGVHYNSGVQNYWFYLLSEGGNGTNDNGDTYDIAGIGMSKAAAIAYRNLTTYLTPTSQYADARTGAIQAAIDLYGADSEEVLQTEAAWSAVGVGGLQLTPNCQYTDSLALVALYNSTNGADWTNTWDLAQPMDTWYGVSVNAEGCVRRLTLDENNLEGQLPPEIGDLSNMERLILNNNPLSGQIPPEIGNAISLEWLWVYSTNQLSGPIPAEIGNLTNLKNLSLNDNKLSGELPPEIGNLINLTSFRISNNQISGQIPAEIGNLSQLTSLNLGLNKFIGSIPPEIGNLSQLKYLTLSRNELTGQIPVEIGNLNELSNLDLVENELSGTLPSELGNLTNLYIFKIYNNQFSGCYDTNLANLCAQLSSSFNTNTQISNGNNFDTPWEDFCATGAGGCTPLPEVPCRQRDSLALVALYDATDGANWTNTWDLARPMDTWYGVTLNGEGCVTCLDLDGEHGCTFNYCCSGGNNLLGTLPAELGDLGSLNYLSLSLNQLSGSMPAELGKLDSLKYFYITSNELTGSIPPELGNLNSIEELRLNGNELTGSIPPQLGNLTNLTLLRLNGNKLSGSLPAELGQLSNLVTMYIDHNQFIGYIPPELGDLHELRYLTLGNNLLSGNIPSELSNLTNIRDLIIGKNLLNGTIPPELGTLGNLRSLDIESNQLTGNIPLELGQLGNLTSLKLGSNKLSGTIPEELGNLTSLISLQLRNNELEGNIPGKLGNLSNLGYLYLNDNQLSGCYDNNLTNFCTQLVSNYIDDGNNFDAPWEDFCATGAGSCAPVWPGDFNNDGVANNIDAIFWGLAAGNTGSLRPGATTSWVAQASPQWQQSVIGVNGKHQDADGNGIVDVNDLNVLVQNYDSTHTNIMPIGASSPLQFEIKLIGRETPPGEYPRLRYGIYLSSDIPINLHGLAFSLDLSDFAVIGQPQIETAGSTLAPSETLEVYDEMLGYKRLHVALTRTDKNNQLIINGDLIAQGIVAIKDLPTGEPLNLRIEGGNAASANGTISAVNGTSLYSQFDNGIDVPFSTSISVVHEQCYKLGSASVEVLEGTPPYTYSWSTGANTAQVTHLNAGTYNVEVSDANGQQQSITVQIDAPAALYDNAGNQIDCPQPSWLMPELYVTLEGAYDTITGMMTNALQQLNVLPNAHPYQVSPWNYRGTEGQDWTAVNYPQGTVDWVLVSFLDAQNTDKVYAKMAAILRQDGSLYFPHNRFLSAEIADSVHVLIQHRNHIAVMTPQPLSIDNKIITHDFRTTDSFRTSASTGQKQLPNGTWVMLTGDCDQSDQPGYDINGQDKALWSPANGTFGDYFAPDLNLDGDVNGQDKGLWFENNGISSQVPK